MNNLQEDRKRDSDLEFLQRCKDSDLDTLLKMLRDHTGGPEWKVVAIKRAIKKRQ